MCDQTSILYSDGDIVWVKLGPCWWPGEVQSLSKIPQDAQESFKKEPIACVKFFKEDKYEFVKNLDHIYKYNCRRKHEFIKKGLDKHREKVKFMEKFPEDVVYAETITNGDPDIVNSKEFAPEKRINYAEIFGESTPKRGKLDKNKSAKHRLSLPAKLPSTSNVTRIITHARFIGVDDHQVLYREQPVKPYESPTTTYTCHNCGFRATRQNVIVLHNKSHINGTYTSFSTSNKKPTPAKKPRKPRPKKEVSKDETGKPLKKRTQYTEVSSDEDDDDILEEKKTTTTKTASAAKSPAKSPAKSLKKSPKRKTLKAPTPPPKKPKIDIKKKLLDDWEDDESEEEELKEREAAKDEATDTTKNDIDNKVKNGAECINPEESQQKDKASDEKKDEPTKSCFDFDEEEDQAILLQNSSPGRKIPRVIPQNQKRSSLTVESEIPSEKSTESVKSDTRKSTEDKEENLDDLSNAVDNLLEVTKVPDIELPQPLKPEKNFHDAKTIKFPDKLDSESESKMRIKSPEKSKSPKSPVAQPSTSPKIQNPKKRIVKSFEDFELNFHNEQKTSETEPIKEIEVPKSPIKGTVNVSELKSQVMMKINETPVTPEPPKRQRRTSKRYSHYNEEKVRKSVEEPKIDDSETAKNMNGSNTDKNRAISKDNLDKDDEPMELETESLTEVKENLLSLTTLAVAASEANSVDSLGMDNNEILLGEKKQDHLEEIKDKVKEIEPFEEESQSALKVDEILLKADSPAPKDPALSRPVTLSSFSMDFSDSNNDSTSSLPCVEPVKVQPKKDDKVGRETVKMDFKSDKEPIITESKLKTGDLINKVIDDKLNSKSELQSELNKETKTDKRTAASSLVENISAELSETTSSSKLLEMLTETKQAKDKDDTTIKKSPPVISPTTNIVMKGTRKLVTKYEVDKKQQIIQHPSRNVSTRIVSEPKTNPKFIIKSTSPATRISNSDNNSKPIILSEKIIKPIPECQKISVKKVISSNRMYPDADDIDAFIIQKVVKGPPPPVLEEENSTTSKLTSPLKGKAKPKIIQQTIITGSGGVPLQMDISGNTQQASDDAMFDINSMPIVLSDDIISTDSIENMQVITDVNTKGATTDKTKSLTLLNKNSPKVVQDVGTPKSSNLVVKNIVPQGLGKNQRIYQTTSKLMKNNAAVITQAGKPGRFVIVPSSSSAPTGTKYTVGKRTQVMKTASNIAVGASGTPKPKEDVTGNKVMIMTNQQGVQSKVMLTPSQQKMVASAGTKVGQKTVVHSKNILSTSTKTSTVPLQNSAENTRGQILTAQSKLASADGLVRGIKQTSPAIKGTRIVQQKILVPDQTGKIKQSAPKTKTILIKNQDGEVIKKLQAPDSNLSPEELKSYYLKQGLSEQMSETLANQRQQLMQPSTTPTLVKKTVMKTEIKPQITKPTISAPKMTPKRSYVKRPVPPEIKQKQQALAAMKQSEVAMPPLAPISPIKKSDEKHLVESGTAVASTSTVTPGDTEKGTTVPQKPLNQLVIQDAMGNQTTVTEGQILALPSETVDGQPQSYMLVTLDESGNLTPLNNEALLSLDPNLLGGDLSNVVLQIDQKEAKPEEPPVATATVAAPVEQSSVVTPEQNLATAPVASSGGDPILSAPAAAQQTSPEKKEEHQPVLSTAESSANLLTSSANDSSAAYLSPNLEQPSVTYSINSDSATQQQLIITGDPISAQKFLESLTEGNPDISNLLANAEGNIIINADGQQILINTDADNQMLLSVGAELPSETVGTETDHNPVLGGTPSSKNQDILAAALADTDVFQPDTSTSAPPSTKLHSQLSPNSSLYPSNVSNVLETSLTLGSPIMTPLEVPSVPNKKVTEMETDILQVPKSLELPITITDPNISQTVSHQQALLANEKLALTIADPGIASTSEINSSSYDYSLPTIEVTPVQKPKFTSSISMPLLTEEPEPEAKEEVPLPLATTSATISSVPEISPLDATSAITITTVANTTTAAAATTTTTAEETKDKIVPVCLRSDMCSSLSEPPPDMFDISFNAPNSTETEESNGLPNLSEEPIASENTDSDNIGSNFDSFSEEPSNNLTATPSSELNSPRTANFDENSCEIPIQPPIVTDLAEQTFPPVANETETTTDSAENSDSKKRSREDEEEPDSSKKSKVETE